MRHLCAAIPDILGDCPLFSFVPITFCVPTVISVSSKPPSGGSLMHAAFIREHIVELGVSFYIAMRSMGSIGRAMSSLT